jgi:uncharacterized membrane protein YeiB
VDLETHAVPEAVRETVPITRIVDHTPSRSIDVTRRDAGSQRVDPGLLCRGHDVVDLPQLRRRLAERDGPGHVRVIAAHLRAEVHLDHVAFGERAQMAVMAQAWTLATEKFWRTLALMLVGMALVRHGVHRWNWETVTAARILFASLAVAVPLTLTGVLLNEMQDWDFAFSAFIGRMINYWASPIMAAGWAALILWMTSRGVATWLQHRLEEIGRTALSNYLLQTLLCTTLFYGHGFGWYGSLNRVQLLGVVVMVWVIQMAVTHLWLQRFSTGPVEWVWRFAATTSQPRTVQG